MIMDTKKHWDRIYQEKDFTEVSWYQKKPQFSIDLIEGLMLSKDASIIDIGGGDSLLVDYLIELGYTNLSVLDISEKAILKAKKRLGENGNGINWIVSDITDFKPNEMYDVWHDRAAFHFLTDSDSINRYKVNLNAVMNKNAFFLIGAFSLSGPSKCSGIPIKQYNSDDLASTFKEGFTLMESKYTVHNTPHNMPQEFCFATFQKKE